MINRTNWKLINAYLNYRREVDQISATSQRLEESRLRQLLEWAGDKPFGNAPHMRPVFPEYVVKARIDGKGIILSPVYVNHVIGTAHAFFRWLPKHRRGFGTITEAWLDTLKPPRMTIEHKEHEAVTLDEMRAIVAASAVTLAERRIKAAACFWFLSGIRIGAFVTLPLEAVDLESMTVKQWPRIGVKTKFSKHATTYLLNIPELLQVVAAWDKEVRAICGDKGLWFAQASPDTGKIIQNGTAAGVHRGQIATRDLRKWLKRVGLTYHSPHKFRHGHAVFALKMAKDIAALKAISQNMMHANISITDGIYGMLSGKDTRSQILSLSNLGKVDEGDNTETLVAVLRQLADKLEAERRGA